nr:zinc finger CCCH domain-containing protein 17 [Ipomoea batatas]
MDGSHRPNPQAPPPPAGAAAAAAAPPPMTSAEEEAIKKNTDCVYFLASPLTCKKGSECEYRHSDNARLNPRDCWYWLNGNCLNPKCAFRHPPLDGLLGNQAPNPVEPFMPPVQAPFMPPVQAAAPAAQVPYFANKQGVPCIFFQKGICLKGDRCPFLHGPNTLINKAPPQKQGVLPTTEVSSKKTFGGLEKCTQEKNNPQNNVLKTGELPPVAKPVAKEGPALVKNHFLVDKNMAPISVIDNEPLKYKPISVPPNGNPVGRSSQMQHQHGFDDPSMHNKDDEISREASPGFDVLVDDELRESDYYPVEDQYGGAGDHERSEYDIDPAADYSIGDIDQDMYRDAHGYDSYAHYGWEQRGASSERKSGRSSHPERRYGNADSSDQFSESDLRHRLSKHRRVNGLRSVISHEQTRERHVEDQSYRSSRRESNNLSSHESSLSNRLRGRIKIPGRSSSPTDVAENRSDREMDRGRDRGRFSHGRPQVPSHQGRLQDRIKGRVQEDLNYVGRNIRGPPLRGDMLSETNINFAGPKSLAELKGKKGGIEGNGPQSLGKRKHQKYDDQLQSGGDLSFEGPKPLEEILKRKRRAGENEDYNQQERTTTTEPYSHKNEADHGAQKEDFQPPSGNNTGALENKSAEDLEVEDGMLADEGAEYQDGEGYDPQDGDYNYEQVDGEDVNLDEAENGDQDEEYLEDDDDADDFAKKMAVVFS